MRYTWVSNLISKKYKRYNLGKIVFAIKNFSSIQIFENCKCMWSRFSRKKNQNFTMGKTTVLGLFAKKKFNIIVIIWTTFEPISEISQLVFPLWNFKIFYVKKLPTLPHDPENLNGDYFWLQTRWPQRLFPIRIFMFLVMRFETHQVIARPWKWSIT